MRLTRTARCTCGMRLALHFKPNGRKLTCVEARLEHRRAGIKQLPLAQLLQIVIAANKG